MTSEKYALATLPEHDRQQDTATSVQLASLIETTDWAQAELILEFDSNTDTWSTSEATLALESGAWELVIGRQDIAFGEYFSHFASGPIVEFGEINDTGISLAYDHRDRYDIALTAYRGRAQKTAGRERLDWNIALQAWPSESLGLGLSYLSDLADSDEGLLAESGNRYDKKIPAWSGYVLWLEQNFEVSLEAVAALDDFVELETDRNRPAAWNLELVYYFNGRVAAALRMEASRELEDAPRRQAGIALNYRLHDNAAITFEALRGSFSPTLATDDNDRDYDHIYTLASQLSVAF